MASTAAVLVIATLIVPASVAMIVWNRREWRHWQQAGLDAADLEYRHRQFLRRIQTSIMLGLLGLMMGTGQLLTEWAESPRFTVLFWTITLLLLVWIILLALVDIWATRRHFGRIQQEIFVQRLALEAAQRRASAEADDSAAPADATE